MSYQPYVDPVGMDPRHYGFVDSVKRAFSQYAKFDGVASIAEYWWFVLFNAIVGGVLYFLAIVLAIGAAAGSGDEEAAGVSGGIVLLNSWLVWFGGTPAWTGPDHSPSARRWLLRFLYSA